MWCYVWFSLYPFTSHHCITFHHMQTCCHDFCAWARVFVLSRASLGGSAMRPEPSKRSLTWVSNRAPALQPNRTGYQKKSCQGCPNVAINAKNRFILSLPTQTIQKYQQYSGGNGRWNYTLSQHSNMLTLEDLGWNCCAQLRTSSMCTFLHNDIVFFLTCVGVTEP